jgi:hypothetical protein
LDDGEGGSEVAAHEELIRAGRGGKTSRI